MANEFRVKNGLIVGNTKQMFFNGTTGKLTIGSDLTTTIDETVRDEALLHLITNNDDSDGDGVVSYDMIIERLMGDADSPNKGPVLALMSSNTDNSGSGSTDMIDDTDIGQILWRAHTDSSEANFGMIRINIQDASNAAKDSKMFFKVQKANSITEFLTLDGGNDKVVVPNSGFQIGSGATVTTIATSTSLGTSNTTLSTTGAIKSYVDANAGGSVGGSDTELLYNDGGTENGIASLTWTDTAGSEQLLLSDASDTSLFKIIQTGTGDALEVHDEASDTTVFKVDQSGHVQIGTTSETIGALRVKGYQGTSSVSSVSTYRISRLEDGVTGSLEITSSQSDGDMYVGAGSTGADLIFHTRRSSPSVANYENIRLTSNGEIGIEGSNFGSSGQVLTSGGSGAAVSWSTISGGASAIDDLSDAITTATSNIGLGSGALDSLTASSGNYNVALGINAGTAITTGDRNIAIGYGAGDGYDAESDNIAIGYDALGGASAAAAKTIAIGNYAADALTTASEIIAIGYNAAGSLTTGYSNTGESVYIGNEAGAAITNGTANVVVGHKAGQNLSTYTSGTLRCSYNVLIGFEAGQQQTIGGRNLAIGTRAMWLEQETGYNTYVGNYSGLYARGAEKNTALGYGALQGQSNYLTGDYNTGIGYNSLSYISSGATNIAIGHEAGNNITSGSNNVVIGAADVSSATGDNQLSISSGDGGVTWITGASTGVVNFPNGLTSGGSAVGGASAIGELSDAITTATSNIGLGSGALDSLTASSGNYNVALGINAGTAITTGDRNISIGYGAADNFDTESDNIAIGYDALGGPVAGGEQNLAIGNYTLDALTFGDGNVALGYQSGTAVQGGSDNVMVGRQAGQSVTSGGENILVGTTAGAGITTGSNNIVMGENAMNYISAAASNNIYLGKNAANGDNHSGNDNIGIGERTGFLVTSGSKNIMLGYQAGNNISTGSNNVVIGNADVPSATGSDQLSISSGDGGVTWITGDSDGGIASKAQVVAVTTGTTVLTEAQSGSYVYVTGGAVTLPTSATKGTQFTIFNNTGSDLTVGLGTNNSIVSNWATNAAVSDNEATSYICVSATNWVQVG